MASRRSPSVTTTLSSREFKQDTSRAKKAAQHGPVIITDRGQPSHVLLTIEAYERLCGPQPSIVELLAMPGPDDLEFEAPRARNVADFASTGVAVLDPWTPRPKGSR
jgi:prevent-host-death family protein